MIFIPCVVGISHNEVEDMTPEWSTAGGQVLLRAILELATTASGLLRGRVVTDRLIGECYSVAGTVRWCHMPVDDFRSDLPQIVG